MTRRDDPAAPCEEEPDGGLTLQRLRALVLVVLRVVMVIEIAALIWRGLWLNAGIAAVMMVLTLSPLILRERLPVRVPYSFQFLVVVFVFASLFLGEVQRFYDRFWWWDIGLHFSSGLLLGLLGFLLIYLLNEDDRVHLSMRPGFMALFAFCFAVSLGAIWEIFEYGADTLFGANMQKSMLGDDSGLTDSMFDLMLDALGGLIISLYGLRYMQRNQPSFITRWIERAARIHPDLFRRPFNRPR